MASIIFAYLFVISALKLNVVKDSKWQVGLPINLYVTDDSLAVAVTTFESLPDWAACIAAVFPSTTTNKGEESNVAVP